MSTPELLEQLISTIRTMPPFPYEHFMNRLFNKTRHCQSVAIFRDSLPPANAYGEDPDSAYIDGVYASDYLELFAEQSAVHALASLDNSLDKYNLRGCVDTSTAKLAANNVITNITSLFYGEHINWHLRSKNTPTLSTLSNIPGFAEAFTSEIQQPRFVKSEIYTDMVRHTHEFSLSILFVCEYLHHGPGVVPHIDEEFALSPSGNVLGNWIDQISSLTLRAPLEEIIIFCSKSASLVHATTNNSFVEPPTLSNLVKSIFDSSVLSTITGIDFATSSIDSVQKLEIVTMADLARTTIGIEEWESMAAINLSLWDNFQNNWQAAVVVKTKFSTSTTRETHTDDGSQFGRGFIIGVTAGAVDHQDWQTRTSTGEPVAEWINEGRRTFGPLFVKDAPNVTEVENFSTNDPAWGSCFAAGTQIETDMGPVAIEAISEGTRILTDATSGSYGVTSDEDVVAPLAVPLLIGINGEDAFFTPGHVFHTTTGLRAMEPVTARRENQWLHVGKLETGHVLYRLAPDGKSYELVKVKSLEVGKTTLKVVHGLHLREGLRQYHANGYLVAMNYPEITIKSVARILSTFPKKDRVNMLRHIKELEPVFLKFGASTVSDVLTKELEGVERKTVPHPAHMKHRQISNIQHVRRTYQLHASGHSTVPEYILPSLALHEGVVLVDGEAQPRASIDPKALHICWTRRTADHGFEHGLVELVKPGLSGRGVILLSDDPDLEHIPQAGSRKLIPFTVAKANVRVGGPFHSLDHAKVRKNHPSTRITSRSHNSRQPAKSLNRLPPDFMTLEDTGTIDGEDYYDLLVDRDIWPKDTEKEAPTNPVAFGQVAFATYHTAAGARGASVPILTVPLLDKLRDEINKTRTLDAQIGPLYSSVIEEDINARLVGTITLDEAALIANLADKSSDDVLPTMALTFNDSLNTGSFTLPILFQTVVVAFNWNFSALSGAAYVFNPDMRGCLGERHKIVTTSSDLSLTQSIRSANANAVSFAGKRHAATPALVTSKLVSALGLSLDALTGFPGYDEIQVHTTSQTLLQNMMYYHMDDNSRTTFLQFPKPQNLPLELGENLSQNLKAWIHDVYAPAYITFMISQVDNKDVTWRDNLTDDEKAKVWYWWSGGGTTCLSRAIEYNDLNALTATAAMDKLYGTALRPYRNDNGPKWAKDMLTSVDNTKFIASIMKSPMNGGVNIINKYCNILHYLDPTQDYGDQLFKDVLKYATTSGTGPYIGLDDPNGVKGREWLFDAMTELGTMVLDNDSRLDPSLRASLQQDLTDLQMQYGDLSGLSNRQRMRIFLDLGETFQANLGRWMSAISLGLAKAYQGSSRLQKAAAVFDKAIALLPKADTGKGVLLKGIGTIAMAAMYIGTSINSFMQWDILDGADKATLIVSTLLITVDTIGRSIDVFNSYKAWKGKDAPTSQQNIDAAVLDQEVTEALGSEKTIAILEEQIGPEAGPLGLKGSVANRQTEFGPPTRNTPANEGEIFETPIVNEKTPILDEPIPPSGKRDWRNFNKSEAVLKGITVALGIALTVAMSLDLKNHWNDLNTVGKVLSTVQIVSQGVSILVDVALLIENIATQGIGAAGRLFTVLPIVGAVIAVIGVVISVVLMFVNTSKSKTPPPTPVEAYLNSVVHPILKGLNSPPSLSLQYDIPATVPANSASPGSITFTVKNTSDKTVTLTQTQFTIEGGDDAACLFKNTDMTLSNARLEPSSVVAGNVIPNARGEKVVSYELDVFGSADKTRDDVDDDFVGPQAQLVLQSNESFTVTWTGLINKIGTSTVEIIETLADETGDRCRLLKSIQRV